MVFIATYWFVWMIGMFTFAGFALGNQLARMKRLMSGNVDIQSFSKGLSLLAVSGFGAAVCAVLFVTSVVLQFTSK